MPEAFQAGGILFERTPQYFVNDSRMVCQISPLRLNYPVMAY